MLTVSKHLEIIESVSIEKLRKILNLNEKAKKGKREGEGKKTF